MAFTGKHHVYDGNAATMLANANSHLLSASISHTVRLKKLYFPGAAFLI
jgi:hypothetical protein